jgi:hypothetical protein
MATLEFTDLDLQTLAEVFSPHMKAAQLANKINEQLKQQQPPAPPANKEPA